MNTSDFSPLAENGSVQLEYLHGKDSLKINRLGAKIALRIKGVELLTTFSSKRTDGKPAISHPCTPVFGNFGQIYDLPQHGPARSATWELVSHIPGLQEGETRLRYNIIGGTYPTGVEVTQLFSLKDGIFTLTTIHQNNGKIAAPVNFGEHLYWWTNYSGWDNATLNGEPLALPIAQNGQIKLKPANELIIPHNAVIKLEQDGLPRAVTWSLPHPNNSLYNFDQHYFCLEPVERPPEDFGNPETILLPQQSRQTIIRISLIRNLQR